MNAHRRAFQLVKIRLQASFAVPQHPIGMPIITIGPQHGSNSSAAPQPSAAATAAAATSAQALDSATKQPAAAPTASLLGPQTTTLSSSSGGVASQRQSTPVQPYKGTFDAFRTIIRTEGLKSCWHGFPLSLCTVAVGPVYISTLELTRSNLSAYCDSYSQRTDADPQRLSFMRAGVPFGSGLAASIIAQTLAVPIDLLVQRIQLQRRRLDGQPSRTALQIAQRLVTNDGVVSLWRGYGMSLATSAPFSSIMWATYTHLHNKLQRSLPADCEQLKHFPFTPVRRFLPSDARFIAAEREFFIVPLAAFVAGSVAAVVTAPIDLVRTRLQTSRRRDVPGVRFALRQILDQGGMRGLFTGVTARMLAVAPSSVLMMSAYALLLRVSARLPGDEQPVTG